MEKKNEDPLPMRIVALEIKVAKLEEVVSLLKEDVKSLKEKIDKIYGFSWAILTSVIAAIIIEIILRVIHP
jgi:hypothetical protein